MEILAISLIGFVIYVAICVTTQNSTERWQARCAKQQLESHRRQ